MIVVAGPRIDTTRLPRADGLAIRAYVPDLHRHPGACDIAVVQGGLATTMELCMQKRPFLYFPLGHHFEQQHHVHHRLRQHDAGRRMDYGTSTPATIAAAINEELERPIHYRDVEAGAAGRAAALIGELL